MIDFNVMDLYTVLAFVSVVYGMCVFGYVLVNLKQWNRELNNKEK